MFRAAASGQVTPIIKTPALAERLGGGPPPPPGGDGPGRAEVVGKRPRRLLGHPVVEREIEYSPAFDQEDRRCPADNCCAELTASSSPRVTRVQHLRRMAARLFVGAQRGAQSEEPSLQAQWLDSLPEACALHAPLAVWESGSTRLGRWRTTDDKRGRGAGCRRGAGRQVGRVSSSFRSGSSLFRRLQPLLSLLSSE